MKNLLFFLLLLPGLAWAQVPVLLAPAYPGVDVDSFSVEFYDADTLAYSYAGSAIEVAFRQTPTGPVLASYTTAANTLQIKGTGSNILWFAKKSLPRTTAPGTYYGDLIVTRAGVRQPPKYRFSMTVKSSYAP